MLEKRRRWAAEEGLNPEVVSGIFQNLIEYFVAPDGRVERENLVVLDAALLRTVPDKTPCGGCDALQGTEGRAQSGTGLRTAAPLFSTARKPRKYRVFLPIKKCP
jgi:hypothetical protein